MGAANARNITRFLVKAPPKEGLEGPEMDSAFVSAPHEGGSGAFKKDVVLVKAKPEGTQPDTHPKPDAAILVFATENGGQLETLIRAHKEPAGTSRGLQCLQAFSGVLRTLLNSSVASRSVIHESLLQKPPSPIRNPNPRSLSTAIVVYRVRCIWNICHYGGGVFIVGRRAKHQTFKLDSKPGETCRCAGVKELFPQQAAGALWHLHRFGASSFVRRIPSRGFRV